jgi:hypothetical protein
MKVETAAGSVAISKLADCTVLNPDFSEKVLSWMGDRLFVSEISQIRLLGTEQLFEVVLDDGRVVYASASSRFVMKSGLRKMPPELEPGDSLLPLYLGEDAHGYATYSVPGCGRKRKISRLMAEWMTGGPLEKGTYVAHIDGNRKNHHPDNLRITINKEMASRSYKNKLVKAYDAAQALLDECAAASPMMAKIVGRKGKGNHKVESVRPGVLGRVYTASVRSAGSLSVSGVFLELPS